MMMIIISNIYICIYIYIIAQNLLYLFAGYFQHVSAPVSFPFPWSPFTNWKFLVRTVRILNGTLERVLWMCSIEIREPTCMQHRHGYKYIYAQYMCVWLYVCTSPYKHVHHVSRLFVYLYVSLQGHTGISTFVLGLSCSAMLVKFHWCVRLIQYILPTCIHVRIIWKSYVRNRMWKYSIYLYSIH